MKWSKEDIDLLIAGYQLPQKDLQYLFYNRTWKSIQLKLFRLGLHRGYRLRIPHLGPRLDENTRFFAKVFKTDNCWLWRGCVLEDGYGQFRDDTKRKWRAHRFIYSKTIGDIPPNYVVHHLCENKICVNPKHLDIMLHCEHSRMHNLS